MIGLIVVAAAFCAVCGFFAVSAWISDRICEEG